MTTDYLHGIDVVEIDDGNRPIRTVKSAVIGVVGTAADADETKFPLNTPILIEGQLAAQALGEHGSLPVAIEQVFAQVGAMIVIIRVAKDNDDNAQLANIIGGVGDHGHYQGVQALLASQAVLGITPRILIAPTFTSEATVVNALEAVATRLRAIVVADGPNQTDEAAIVYRQQFDSARVLLVDPDVRALRAMERAKP